MNPRSVRDAGQEPNNSSQPWKGSRMKADADDEQRKTKVDLRTRMTGAEWDEAFSHFWKRATPLWFECLEWLLILGVLTFIYEETGSVLVGVLCGFSHTAFAFYIFSVLFSIELHGFPLSESKRARTILSLIATAALAVTVYLALNSLISACKGKL